MTSEAGAHHKRATGTVRDADGRLQRTGLLHGEGVEQSLGALQRVK